MTFVLSAARSKSFWFGYAPNVARWKIHSGRTSASSVMTPGRSARSRSCGTCSVPRCRRDASTPVRASGPDGRRGRRRSAGGRDSRPRSRPHRSPGRVVEGPEAGTAAVASSSSSPILVPRRRGVQDALDDVWRTSLDLVVDMRQVRPDDAEAGQLDAPEEQDHDDHRGEARRNKIGTEEPDEDLDDDPEHAHQDGQRREDGDQIQWRVREREDRLASPAQVVAARNSCWYRTSAPVAGTGPRSVGSPPRLARPSGIDCSRAAS